MNTKEETNIKTCKKCRNRYNEDISDRCPYCENILEKLGINNG